MKLSFPLCNSYHEKWLSFFFYVSLFNTERNSFNTIMQFINPNFTRKNCFFYPVTKDLNHGV